MLNNTDFFSFHWKPWNKDTSPSFAHFTSPHVGHHPLVFLQWNHDREWEIHSCMKFCDRLGPTRGQGIMRWIEVMHLHKAHAEILTTGCRIKVATLLDSTKLSPCGLDFTMEKLRNVIALTANTENSAPPGLYIHFTTCFPTLVTMQK